MGNEIIEVQEDPPLPPIPKSLHSILFPTPGRSVLHLSQFPIPAQYLATQLSEDRKTFSTEAGLSLDERTAPILRSLHKPQPSDLRACLQLLQELKQKSEGNYQSIGNFEFTRTTRCGDAPITLNLPLWVLSYWWRLEEIGMDRREWATAETALQNDDANDVLPVLSSIPWDYKMPHELGCRVSDLAAFGTEDWLSDIHIDLMFAVNRNEISTRCDRTVLMECSLVQALTSSYYYNPDGYWSDDGPGRIRWIGKALAEGKKQAVGFCFLVKVEGGQATVPTGKTRGNHWIAVVIDVTKRIILYGDPMRYAIPSELVQIFHWWLGHHFDAAEWPVQGLACSSQDDNFSCAVLAVNAIVHHVDGETHRLIKTTREAIQCRRHYIEGVVNLVRQSDGGASFIASDDIEAPQPISVLSSIQLPVSGNFVPKVPAKRANTGATGAAPAKKQRTSSTMNPNSKATEPKTAPVFQAPAERFAKVAPAVKAPKNGKRVKKQAASEAAEDTASEDDMKSNTWGENEESNDEEEEGGVCMDPEDLVELPMPKKRKSGGGAPRNDLVDTLLMHCCQRSRPDLRRWGCRGKCGVTYANRNLARALKHCAGCSSLVGDLAHLKELARRTLATKAVSRKVEASKELQSNVTRQITTAEVSHTNAIQDLQTDSPAEKPKLSQSNLQPFVTQGRSTKNASINLAVIQLITRAGLPPNIVTHPAWHNLMRELRPNYSPQARTQIEDVEVPAEAEAIRLKVIERLKEEENLTVSYDGGTSRGEEAFWTIHISTEDKRVYFVEGIEATSESHTAEWIEEKVLAVCKPIGLERFSGATCDSTGNTRGSRSRLEESIRNIFNIPDPCHHISNTLKEVFGIEHFADTVKVLRGVIAKFHKSHIGASELLRARQEKRITRGLESIGKTRFGTVIRAARTLLGCLPAIELVVARGNYDLGEYAVYFQPNNQESRATQNLSNNFAMDLKQMVELGSPALRALACLEANDCNAGDVCIYWHAMLAEMDTVVEKYRRVGDITDEAAAQIFIILHKRNNEIFGDGRISSASKLFYAGAYLDPVYLQSKSDIFKTDPPAEPNPNADYAGIKHPGMFQTVANFLYETATNEILHGVKEVFTKWHGRAAEFDDTFSDELKRYARQQYPYNEAIREGELITNWWKRVSGAEDGGQILPFLARKVFSVRVNSMAEERTVSQFTWITPANRASMEVQTMVRMTQIKQYYDAEDKAKEQKEKGTKYHPRMRFFEAKKAAAATQTRPPEVLQPADCDKLWPETKKQKNACATTPSEARSESEPAVQSKSIKLSVKDSSLINMSSTWLKCILAQDSAVNDPLKRFWASKVAGSPPAPCMQSRSASNNTNQRHESALFNKSHVRGMQHCKAKGETICCLLKEPKA